MVVCERESERYELEAPVVEKVVSSGMSNRDMDEGDKKETPRM